jgi:acetyltransferase-like isoleucine patch superfamily enzyme
LFVESVRFLRQLGAGAVRGNESAIAGRLRRRALGTVCRIDTDVRVTHAKNFRAGKDSALYHASYILNASGRFTMGERSHLGAFCYVNVCYGEVTIGDDVAIGPGTKIFAYSNHYERGRKVSEVRLTADVSIGDNVFVGANCTILPGTVIPAHVVVAAGSVVRGQLESNAIYGGVPCQKLKDGWYE